MPNTEGLHGGGDRVTLEHLSRGGTDAHGFAADERAGAWPALVGIAANASLALGVPVSLAELASGIPQPDMPPGPFGSATPWQTFDPARYGYLSNAKLGEVNGL
jgi:hypothetical protein